jgi:rod shape-determining protein MreB
VQFIRAGVQKANDKSDAPGKPNGLHTADGKQVQHQRRAKHGILGEMCQLADEIRSFVERIPPQIRMYVLEEGIYLTGGSARIPNIDRYLRRSISCQINLSSFYEMCTVRGLEEMIQSNLLKKWAYTIRKKK